MSETKQEQGHDWLNEICGNCGYTRGSHLANTYYSRFDKKTYPTDYCPGHEGRMDWNNGPGTIFKPTGRFKENDEAEEN